MHLVTAFYDHNSHGVELDDELELLVGVPSVGDGVTFVDGERDLLWKFASPELADEAKTKLGGHPMVLRVTQEEN